MKTERLVLENEVGVTFDTKELQQIFKVISFLAPLVYVERKSDGAKGTLQFIHSPRFYFNWKGESDG